MWHGYIKIRKTSQHLQISQCIIQITLNQNLVECIIKVNCSMLLSLGKKGNLRQYNNALRRSSFALLKKILAFLLQASFHKNCSLLGQLQNLSLKHMHSNHCHDQLVGRTSQSLQSNIYLTQYYHQHKRELLQLFLQVLKTFKDTVHLQHICR